MKNISILFFAASVILLVGCSCPVENAVTCVQLDPLKKVFTEESYFVENSDTAVVAKGETATFQFLVRSIYPIQELKVDAENLTNGDRKIAATSKAFVGYILAGNHANRPSKDARFPLSDYYPDCLIDVEHVDVASMHNQPVWVSYAVPRDAQSGNYAANLIFTGKVNGKSFRIAKQVNAKVYPVTLPEQTLWVTNWFYPELTTLMNNNQPVEPYSDRYWELLAVMAHVMRDHGQNTYIIKDWTGIANIQLSGSQYSFDFTNFDKYVELFIHEGGLKRIEGNHLGGRMGDEHSDFGVYVPYAGMKPMDDVKAQNYLSQFLPALYNHLEKKGWKAMYVQHVADEPIDRNADSYIHIAEFVKKHMPGIPIIDAVMSRKLSNTLDVWVPHLENYHKDYSFFRERQVAGDEIWYYTCCGPEGNYANRFLEQPLIQTRYLHWINYR